MGSGAPTPHPPILADRRHYLAAINRQRAEQQGEHGQHEQAAEDRAMPRRASAMVRVTL